MCSEHSSEDNLETVASNLPTKEFVIPQGTPYIIIVESIFLFTLHPPSPPPSPLSPPDVASHLQGHCHWLVEMAVKVVSAITKGTSDTVSFYGYIIIYSKSSTCIYLILHKDSRCTSAGGIEGEHCAAIHMEQVHPSASTNQW